MKYKECEFKRRDEELFVSRIFKLEPEDVVFMKPVTVLLSHSVHEDQVFQDFYELLVEKLSPSGWQQIKTEIIRSSKGMNSNINYSYKTLKTG